MSTIPSRRRPTIYDVAARAQVSFKTVSRVVNREPHVSAATIERVEKAIAEVGDPPDSRASSLARAEGRTGVIGFVFTDNTNPEFWNMQAGIEKVAREHGYTVLVCNSYGDPDIQKHVVQMLGAQRVDGLLVVPALDDGSSLVDEQSRGTPIVLVDREPKNSATLDVVRADHVGASRIATEHLLHHGHRDIAYFGPPRFVSAGRMRLDGFRRAMRAAGVTVPDERIVTGIHGSEAWEIVIGQYLDRSNNPTAIYAGQSQALTGAVSALRNREKHRDIALMGFDDIVAATFVEPQISTMRQDTFLIGSRAAERLLSRLEAPSSGRSREVLACQLIERGSGEITPSARKIAKR